MLRYLGRYTHRVAISNHRLLAFDGKRVTFRWKDYAHGNRQRKMTLSATEFLRRFLQHVLPQGFVRIRHFSFLANSCRTARLSVAWRLLTITPREPSSQSLSDSPTWRCPHCATAMRIVPNLTAVQLASAVQYLRQLINSLPFGVAAWLSHASAVVCLHDGNRPIEVQLFFFHDPMKKLPPPATPFRTASRLFTTVGSFQTTLVAP